MMLRRLLTQTFIVLLAQGWLLYRGARTTDWPAFWAFLALFGLGSLAVGLFLLRHDPALLRERMTLPVHGNQSRRDKLLLLGVGLLWCFWLFGMGRDAAGHGFAGLPGWLQVLGALLFLGGYAMTAWTFAANSFASPAVRMQPERGHHVIDTGPYAHVRHPMYAGALLLFLGMPLLLGSPLGLLGFPIGAAVLALRTRWEEAALRAGLPGYDDYTHRVRCRFVPGLW
ncbi:methyltransferase family protein [Dankookia sp. GCM10030260]|uniref:methyltransferase family protein n=1 Tax=Dankookia sp. GCM10030260 TaxID=3273390 RepID=UPI003610B733